MNTIQRPKLKILLLLDIVINFGIGVNVEGLTRVIPSTFSTKAENIYYTMKMKSNYKLPSFRLGFMEVVTVAASAVTASFHSIKMNYLLKALYKHIAPGRTNILSISFNTAFSQSFIIGRMVYEVGQVKKLLHKTYSLPLSLLHNPILPHKLPQFCPIFFLRNLFSADYSHSPHLKFGIKTALYINEASAFHL